MPNDFYAFLEGPDDSRFFRQVLESRFKQAYRTVRSWEYAQQTAAKVDAFLKSVKAMRSDYVFFADINHWPCATGKKDELGTKYPRLDSSKIIVVVPEIESWYFAGLSNASARSLGVPEMRDTDHLVKEACRNFISKKFDTRIDLFQEVLKCFEVEIAIRRNKSFGYFWQKWLSGAG